MEETVLPLPVVRCLSKEQAAEYLGIGVTLLTELEVPFTKLGRRCVFDKVDLDEWLNEYKQRGRAGKETIWLVKPESTGDRTLDTGGLVVRSKTAKEYAKVLGLKTGMKQKPC
jgi:excisionase family DNA binding protein